MRSGPNQVHVVRLDSWVTRDDSLHSACGISLVGVARMGLGLKASPNVSVALESGCGVDQRVGMGSKGLEE